MRLLSLLLLLFVNSLSAQIVSRPQYSFQGFMGSPSEMGNSAKDYSSLNIVDGTPYFQKEWSKAQITTPDKKVMQDVSVRIDLLENKVYYLNSQGKELVITEPLREILLKQKEEDKTIIFVDGHVLPVPKTGWFHVLVNDTVSLVKGIKKAMNSRIPYGMEPEYSITTKETYFVYKHHQEFPIKKPADFKNIFPEKKEEIEQQLKKINTKLPLEEQLVLMTTYCNTMQGVSRF